MKVKNKFLEHQQIILALERIMKLYITLASLKKDPKFLLYSVHTDRLILKFISCDTVNKNGHNYESKPEIVPDF